MAARLQIFRGRMWLWWWRPAEACPYRSAMNTRMRNEDADANADRELANMADYVTLTSALAGIAEVEVWRLETLSAAGIDTDEKERIEAAARLTDSLGTYGREVKRMLDCGTSLTDIARLTGLEINELRLALPYAS